jgi:hypothetical protein
MYFYWYISSFLPVIHQVLLLFLCLCSPPLPSAPLPSLPLPSPPLLHLEPRTSGASLSIHALPNQPLSVNQEIVEFGKRCHITIHISMCVCVCELVLFDSTHHPSMLFVTSQQQLHSPAAETKNKFKYVTAVKSLWSFEFR